MSLPSPRLTTKVPPRVTVEQGRRAGVAHRGLCHTSVLLKTHIEHCLYCLSLLFCVVYHCYSSEALSSATAFNNVLSPPLRRPSCRPAVRCRQRATRAAVLVELHCELPSARSFAVSRRPRQALSRAAELLAPVYATSSRISPSDLPEPRSSVVHELGSRAAPLPEHVPAGSTTSSSCHCPHRSRSTHTAPSRPTPSLPPVLEAPELSEPPFPSTGHRSTRRRSSARLQQLPVIFRAGALSPLAIRPTRRLR
jgi:hypothetical protein